MIKTRLEEKEPDFLVVIAYGNIIPQHILDIPKIAPINIIKAITLNPAECLNVNKNVGSVKVGMVADLVILNANPLESASNLKNINAVIKFGSYYTVNQLQELLDNSILNDNK